ncbi:MAG: BspA family leucine-rich repeat surface protein, partial [Clostridia bacterium]|nr:BspA family leucine-rich repeat surface protein [Clostridia bacterium]
YYCSALQQLDLSNFNTAGVTQMQGMFCNCTALQRLDLSSFVIGEETNTDGMLYHCNALFSLKLGAGFRFNDGHSQTNNDNPNAWDIGTFVNACLPDAPTDAAHTGKWIRENGEGSAYTAEALMDVYDGTTMADTWVWQPLQAYAVFNGTAGTLTFCVGGLEADGVHRTAGGDPVSGDEYYTGFLTDTYTQQESVPWRDNRENVTTVTFLDTVAPVSTASWFSGFTNLTAVNGIDHLDTSSVTNMAGMFSGCSSLTSLDVSGWDTGSVTSMSSVFAGCSALTSLDVGSWNTGSVTDMCCMFKDCPSLTSLDVSGWDTGSVTNMGDMFAGCSSLNPLDVGSWNTGSVTQMYSLFQDCSALTALDVGSWETGSVTQMYSMFSGCSSLTSLNVSSWDTGSVSTMFCMFNGCSSLTALNLGSWDTGSVTNISGIFSGCSALAALTLGEDFSFVSGTDCNLPDVPNDSDYTGKWINQTAGLTKTSQELMTDYNGATMNGTWVWQPRIDISGATISPIADQTYTGEALTPAVTVTLADGTVLVPDTDYTVEYGNNTNKGTATVTVTGNGNYAGTLNETFEITAKSLDGATVTVADQTYTGEALTPDVTVTLPDGTVLTPGTDYTVEYSNNTDPGTATVTVTGNGNYAGTLSESFEVTAYDISDASVTADKQKYTGEALTPAVKVELSDGTILTEGTDYTVEYSNNTEPGRANITVTGKGFYTGTAFGTFTITDEDEPIDSEELFKQSSILDLLRKLIKAIVAFFKKFC